MKKTTDTRKKEITLTGKYTPLITATSELSVDLIDAIADKIVETGLPIKDACVSCGVDYECLNVLFNYRHNSEPNYQLKLYAENAFKIAPVQFEEKLTKILLDPQQFNSTHLKMVERLLEIVSPRFSKQLKVMYKYDMELLLSNIAQEVDQETFLKILERIKSLDPYNCVAELDEKLI
jgi:hypothetical protein